MQTIMQEHNDVILKREHVESVFLIVRYYDIYFIFTVTVATFRPDIMKYKHETVYLLL